jgi:hypothetical protein
MRPAFTLLAAILLLASLAALHAAEPFSGAKTNHHGVSLYSVPFGNEKASVLVPNRPAVGRPWVLAGSLYKLDSPPVANMARTELELVNRGFLADPNSKDPVARESTRLWCAAVSAAQTTLDPQQMKGWTPNSSYGGHAFGYTTFNAFLADREKILPWIAEYSPYALVSAGDSPVYLGYGAPPALGQNGKDPTHTTNFGLKLQERCQAVGVSCELVYPGAPGAKHTSVTKYLIATLKEDAAK